MLDGLIFDLDGCLIDSKDVQKAAFAGSYNIVVGDDNCPSYEEYIKHTGDSIDNVLVKMGLPIEMADPFRKMSRELVHKINVNWEAIKLIEHYRDRGVKISICTGKDHDRTEEILKHYGIFLLFDVLVCADDVKEPKPSPEPVQQAVEKMKTTKDSVVLIGDGFNDIISAKNAGVKSILTLWYGDVGVSRDSDYVVNSVKELEGVLDALL